MIVRGYEKTPAPWTQSRPTLLGQRHGVHARRDENDTDVAAPHAVPSVTAFAVRDLGNQQVCEYPALMPFDENQDLRDLKTPATTQAHDFR